MFYYKVVWFDKYKGEDRTEAGVVQASSYKKATKILTSKKKGYGKEILELTLISEEDKIISYSDFSLVSERLMK